MATGFVIGAYWDHPKKYLVVFIVLQNLVEIETFIVRCSLKMPIRVPKIVFHLTFKEEQYQRDPKRHTLGRFRVI